jgi:cyclopropane-fatty-acyl-phospholipid synthase
MHKRFSRLVGLVEKQYKTVTAETGLIPFALKMNGQCHHFGADAPAFSIKLNDENGIAALSTLEQDKIADAYLSGCIDLEGDITKVLALRELFNDKKGARFLWRFIQPMLFGQVKSDKKWIANHYDTEEDFFLLFLDKRYRAYSQAVFAKDNESLEDAQTRSSTLP